MNIIYLTTDWFLAARNMLTMWAYTSFVSFYLAFKIYFPCCDSASAPVLKLCWQLYVKVSFCIFHRDNAHLFIPTGASLEQYVFILINFLYFFFTQLGQQSSLVGSLGITFKCAVKCSLSQMWRCCVVLGELIPGRFSPCFVCAL